MRKAKRPAHWPKLPISEEEKAKRRPPPPDYFVGALQSPHPDSIVAQRAKRKAPSNA